jgi:probable HAF family extracellular repeat protein
MRPATTIRTARAAAVLVALLIACPLRAQLYRATLLSTDGAVTELPNAINNQGVIVGSTPVGNGYSPVVYTNDVPSLLDTPFGWMFVNPAGVDSAGVVFGSAYVNDNDVLVAWVLGNVTILTSAPAAVLFVHAVNDSGTVVGGIEDTATDGFIYSAGSLTDLGLLPGDVDDALNSVNNSGTAVGTGVTPYPALVNHAIGATLAGLYDLGWGAGSQAVAINDSGTIAGLQQVGGAQAAVVSVNGVISPIVSTNWSAFSPMAINNGGMVVGTATLNVRGTPENLAFTYQDGVTTDLNTLVNIPGVTLGSATAITAAGQILAVAQDQATWYVLSPVSLHFSVSAPASASLGTPVTITVTALDAQGNPAPYYDGTLQFTSSDGAAVLPIVQGLISGVRTFDVTFSTLGSQTVTVTDTLYPSITGTSAPVAATLGPRISAQPASQAVNAGSPATFSVAATGQPAPAYQWSFDGAAIPGATAPSYTVADAQAANSGSYAVVVSNSSGSVASASALLTVTAPSGGPAIAEQPSSYSIVGGQTVVLTVGASSGTASSSLRPLVSAALSYKWYLNGNLLSDGAGISGSQEATLILSGASAVPGSYACLIEDASGSVLSQAAELSLSSAAYPSRLINVSCRAQVGQGADILIAGFVVGRSAGNASLPVLIRGSGPALSGFGVPGVLPDPDLGLYSTSPAPALIASNVAWGGGSALAHAASSVGAFAWTDPSSNDTALLEDLVPGAYTANVSGKSGDSGVALAEVYDATPAASVTASSPRLINISARILVGSGANSLIAGFVVGGTTAKTFLIRASGPALEKYGVSGTIPDPELQLNGSSGVIATSIGWQGDAQIASAAAQVGAFSWGDAATPDSALLVTLPPGSYTANVSGASGDTGVGLVEVYEVP